MTLRRRLLVLVALVTAACGSSDRPSDTATASGSDDGGTATTTTDGTDTDNEPETPPTTFVPALDGPWAPGGAERDSDEGVIIDADAAAELPPTLAQLVWPTDWTRRTVKDWTEFLAGLPGPDPRDGIPPIDAPSFESVQAASQWLEPQEPGALVVLDDEARFYPLSMLTRHEIVNDAFGDVPVAVTYCPLCNTALTFDRRIDDKVLRLGVSGLLRNSDLVMWDSATTSLWQQVTGEALVGEYAGSRLEVIPTAIVSFGQFAERYPDGRSLAAESRFDRGSYGFNPYRGYSSSERPFLFAGEIDDALPALSRVVGVEGDGAYRSYPFELLADRRVINDDVGGSPIVVFWGGDTTDALDRGSIADSRSVGTGIAFDPVVDDRRLVFEPGPADSTFVDLKTGSTWTVLGHAVAGDLAGSQLQMLPHRNEFWFVWQAFFGADTVYAG